MYYIVTDVTADDLQQRVLNSLTSNQTKEGSFGEDWKSPAEIAGIRCFKLNLPRFQGKVLIMVEKQERADAIYAKLETFCAEHSSRHVSRFENNEMNPLLLTSSLLTDEISTHYDALQAKDNAGGYSIPSSSVILAVTPLLLLIQASVQAWENEIA